MVFQIAALQATAASAGAGTPNAAPAAAAAAAAAGLGKNKKIELETRIEELQKQVGDLRVEKEKFLNDLDIKVNEIQECEIRLQLLTSQLNKIKAELEKAHNTIKTMEAEKSGLLARISNTGSFSEAVHDSSFASSSGLSATRVSAAPLFSTVPCNPVITTSTTSPRSTPTFGKSIVSESKPNSTSVSSNTITATSVAGQSNQVSGSIHVSDESIDEVLNAGGESRDSVTSAPVSSTDIGRKRPAAEFSSESDIKRQRDSPNEAVTSSEQSAVPQHHVDDNSVALPQDDENSSSQDAVVYPPEEGRFDDGIQNDEVIEVLSDVESDELDEDYEGDDQDIVGLDQDVELSDAVDGIVQEEGDDEEVEEGEEEDDDDLNAEADEDEDDDILEVVEEDSRSASMDQDREAASAIEEADDEERAPSLPRHEEVSASHSIETSNDNRPARMPIVFNIERDDQCSSSNETSTTTATTTHPAPFRGRPARALSRAVPLYQRGKRGKRGN
ncbi:unnamed protein product [Auanema sp. JU1783]|nr:unnamed protein product [Auanema sp. JU1783]